MKTRIAALVCVVLLGLFVLVTRSCGVWPFNGVIVVINNIGSIDYESCVVNVTGHSYDLRSLPADSTLTTNVSPTGESHVELDLSEYDGSRHHLVVDCYFESHGYSGTIKVHLGDGQIHGVANDIGIGFP